MLTFKYRIKDATVGKRLQRLGWAVHYVWNYCNEVSLLAWRREKRFLSAFDLINLTAGVGHDLGLHTDTISEICQEYAKKKRIAKKIKLKWRSRKRSLGWIPFKGRCVRVGAGEVAYKGLRVRYWDSRPQAEGYSDTGMTLKTGSFTQDPCGHWYVNFQCEVTDSGMAAGHDEIGIDLGLQDQIACTHLPEPLSRANLTRQYAPKLALAQRARKKKRVKALHAKIANIRKDWTHKTTTAIVQTARLIAVGNVSSSKLARTSFAKSTYDAAWGITRALLRYKSQRLGVPYVEVSEYRSSCTCSACDAITGPRGLRQLGVRVWTCSACGKTHQRDINSAHIHLRRGRATLSGIP
jgi:IS605 OrfB family transposase